MERIQAEKCSEKIVRLGYQAEVVKHNDDFFVEVWK